LLKAKMARPEGFEPPTQGLELPGSVQAELRAQNLAFPKTCLSEIPCACARSRGVGYVVGSAV
jgi:hypothetical protein